MNIVDWIVRDSIYMDAQVFLRFVVIWAAIELFLAITYYIGSFGSDL